MPVFRLQSRPFFGGIGTSVTLFQAATPLVIRVVAVGVGSTALPLSLPVCFFSFRCPLQPMAAICLIPFSALLDCLVLTPLSVSRIYLFSILLPIAPYSIIRLHLREWSASSSYIHGDASCLSLFARRFWIQPIHACIPAVSLFHRRTSGAVFAGASVTLFAVPPTPFAHVGVALQSLSSVILVFCHKSSVLSPTF